MNQEFDTDYTNLITCPYCGYVDIDSWEIPEEGEWDCDSCGKRIWISIHTSISYSTRKIET
jgi:DNA-directed RNA polymerase subunit RPC12/RpoP